MAFTLPEPLVWRQFAKGMYVLELRPPGVIVGGVKEEHGGRWRTTAAQHRDGQRQLHAPAATLKQAQYFIGRWTAANLVAIQEECRGRVPCTWGVHSDAPHPLPPGFDPSKVPARPRRRSRKNPSSL